MTPEQRERYKDDFLHISWYEKAIEIFNLYKDMPGYMQNGYGKFYCGFSERKWEMFECAIATVLMDFLEEHPYPAEMTAEFKRRIVENKEAWEARSKMGWNVEPTTETKLSEKITREYDKWVREMTMLEHHLFEQLAAELNPREPSDDNWYEEADPNYDYGPDEEEQYRQECAHNLACHKSGLIWVAEYFNRLRFDLVDIQHGISDEQIDLPPSGEVEEFLLYAAEMVVFEYVIRNYDDVHDGKGDGAVLEQDLFGLGPEPNYSIYLNVRFRHKCSPCEGDDPRTLSLKWYGDIMMEYQYEFIIETPEEQSHMSSLDALVDKSQPRTFKPDPDETFGTDLKGPADG
jgi:hypothetical protein